MRIKPATTLDANGELPIDVELTDRPPRSIGFGVSYETQLGFAVNGFWIHRNLFGEAESLRLTAEINHIGQGSDPRHRLRLPGRLPQARLVAARQDVRLEAAGAARGAATLTRAKP